MSNELEILTQVDPGDENPVQKGGESQTPDTPGNDENGDGLKGGQTTADNHGDILGI